MMKQWIWFLGIIILVFGCGENNQIKRASIPEDHAILGKWIRTSQMGPISFTFHTSGLLEGDVMDNGSIDLSSEFRIKEDTIYFKDISGPECYSEAAYQIEIAENYLILDQLSDLCSQRLKYTLGIWAKQDYKQTIDQLEAAISDEQNTDLKLELSRILLAIGKTDEAREYLLDYVDEIDINPRAYLHLASTRFPHDLDQAINDCNKVIQLDPSNKHAHFLKGLAYYDLGDKEKACSEFEESIKYGFTALREIEYQKCAEFWSISSPLY